MGRKRDLEAQKVKKGQKKGKKNAKRQEDPVFIDIKKRNLIKKLNKSKSKFNFLYRMKPQL